MEETTTNFDKNGLYNDSTGNDKNLFNELKSILYEEMTKGGHSYTPDKFEYRASSIAYCKRKILINKNPAMFLDEEQMKLLPIIDDEVPSKFGASIPGQLIHETIQEILIDKIGDRVSVEEEVSITIGRSTLKGHYDLLIKDNNDELIVIDIKTTNSKREWLPKIAHMRQLMAYQGMLTAMDNKKGIKGAILYVNRNNWELSYVPQEFNKESFTEIIKKITALAGYEDREELPPAVPALPDECGNEYWKCDYYSICFPSNNFDDLEVISDN